MSKIFVDTNLLIYALDTHDKNKRKQSRTLLKSLRDKQTAVISTQVLQEFYVVATRKMGVDPLLAKTLIQRLENFEVVVIEAQLIREAIDCSIIHNISFWDALIVVAAESAKCEVLWTEDLADGQMIRGVRIENPL